MDLTAVAMLEGKDLEIRVFNMDDENNFMKVLAGEDIGTTISKE
jgi:uridylate kinase